MTDRPLGIAGRADAVSFHAVAGGGVLFHAGNGRLYALNPTAGLAWLCVKDGLSEAESLRVMAESLAIDPATARQWLGDSMAAFDRLGLLADRSGDEGRETPALGERSPRPGRAVPWAGRRYRLLDRTIQVNAPPDLQAAIASLLGAVRLANTQDAGDPPVAVQVDLVPAGDAWEIVVQGQAEVTCAPSSVVAEVERLVIQAVVPAVPHLLTLHAAALQRADRTLLLAGPSGSGKTTLSVALAHAGWGFGSDEIVLVEHGLSLRPVPLPPCIKSDSFALIESWFPHLRDAPAHDRYGRSVKFLSIEARRFQPNRTSVVFPRFRPGGGNLLQPMDGFAGLERLLEQCVFVPPGFAHDDVDTLLRWHATLDYFDLAFDCCSSAIDLLSKIGHGYDADLP